MLVRRIKLEPLAAFSSAADNPRCGTESGGGIPLEVPTPGTSEFRRERPLQTREARAA